MNQMMTLQYGLLAESRLRTQNVNIKGCQRKEAKLTNVCIDAKIYFQANIYNFTIKQLHLQNI